MTTHRTQATTNFGPAELSSLNQQPLSVFPSADPQGGCRPRHFGIQISHFCIQISLLYPGTKVVTGYQSVSLDTRVAVWIPECQSGYQSGSLDTRVAVWIPTWQSGYQRGSLCLDTNGVIDATSGDLQGFSQQAMN
ncbi:hypothetical protein ACOMHN_055325 [Nucella lapillus]